MRSLLERDRMAAKDASRHTSRDTRRPSDLSVANTCFASGTDQAPVFWLQSVAQQDAQCKNNRLLNWLPITSGPACPMFRGYFRDLEELIDGLHLERQRGGGTTDPALGYVTEDHKEDGTTVCRTAARCSTDEAASRLPFREEWRARSSRLPFREEWRARSSRLPFREEWENSQASSVSGSLDTSEAKPGRTLGRMASLRKAFSFSAKSGVVDGSKTPRTGGENQSSATPETPGRLATLRRSLSFSASTRSTNGGTTPRLADDSQTPRSRGKDKPGSFLSSARTPRQESFRRRRNTGGYHPEVNEEREALSGAGGYHHVV